ncbi:Acyl-CoA dehydrogenase [Venturia nashicola]|nr:Acyl-CoA dehydrogenase [Venturia nashicola]
MSKQLSTKEVSTHKSVEEGLWIIIDNEVYDVTKFIDEHPGGPKILKRVGGKDASKQFWKASNPLPLQPLTDNIHSHTLYNPSLAYSFLFTTATTS